MSKKRKTDRMKTPALDADELFFWHQAGYDCHPDRETPEEGRTRSAKELADAERWSRRQCCWVEWVIDDDADRSGLRKGDRRPLFGCVLHHPNEKVPAESLWGIDLGKTGNECPEYRRVVAAQLALEMMRSHE